MSEKKKVLVLAYRFPPFGGTGAVRVASFVKYLPEFGWQPSVLTSDWTESNCEQFDANYGERLGQYVVGRVPLRDARRNGDVGVSKLRRGVSAVRREANKHKNLKHWHRAAMRILPDIVKRHGPFHAMFATYPPWTAIKTADWAARRFGIPWISDFRDVFEESTPKPLWWISSRVERRALRSSAMSLTISDNMVKTLRSRHSHPVECLPNGYDPEEFSLARESAPPQSADRFKIVYTGMLYPLGHPARESPSLLFKALDLLAEQKKIRLSDFEIELIGTPRQKAEPHLVGFRSASVAKIIEWVGRQESYERQLSATLLLLLGSSQMRGIMTGKVFEYLASRRPILTIPSDHDCLDDLLQRTGAGASASTVPDCAAIIERLYGQWTQRGELPDVAFSDEVRKYDRRCQAERLARFLDGVSNER